MRSLSAAVLGVALLALGGCSSNEAIIDKVGAFPAQKPNNPGRSFAEVGGDFVRDVGDRIFFDYDKSSLTAMSKAQLDKWVAHLNRYPNDKFLIEGHCDERGTREYNLALGERRATVARNYLVAHGIVATRLKIISYGKERPAVLGSGEEVWFQNRRVVVVVE